MSQARKSIPVRAMASDYVHDSRVSAAYWHVYSPALKSIFNQHAVDPLCKQLFKSAQETRCHFLVECQAFLDERRKYSQQASAIADLARHQSTFPSQSDTRYCSLFPESNRI